jgi:hypothetical protein
VKSGKGILKGWIVPGVGGLQGEGSEEEGGDGLGQVVLSVPMNRKVKSIPDTGFL